MRCAGCRYSICPIPTSPCYGLSVFAIFHGLDWIATVPPTVFLTSERFGRERANLVFGWVFVGHQLAAAAFGAGLSCAVLHSYLPAIATAGALCLVVALLVPVLGRGAGRAKPTAPRG